MRKQKIKGSIQKHKETKNKKRKTTLSAGQIFNQSEKNNQQQNVANENTKKQRKNKKIRKATLSAGQIFFQSEAKRGGGGWTRRRRGRGCLSGRSILPYS